MTIRNVSTNSSKTKLTRPVAMWKRVALFLTGVTLTLVGGAGLAGGQGWLALFAMVVGIGFVYQAVTDKTETLG